MAELELALGGFEVNSGFGFLVACTEGYSSVLDFNVAISALDAVDNDNALALVGGVTQRLLLLKDEHAWLVVVQDGHTGRRILSNQLSARALLVHLNIEVFIWFPSLVVNDFYFQFILALTILEGKYFVNGSVVFVSFSLSIDSSNMNSTCSICLV